MKKLNRKIQIIRVNILSLMIIFNLNLTMKKDKIINRNLRILNTAIHHPNLIEAINPNQVARYLTF